MIIQTQVDSRLTTRDYDFKSVRRALRREARAVQKLARKMASRKAVSLPGEAPGRLTGRLRKSIKVKRTRNPFTMIVAPGRIPDVKEFYPAFVLYGHRGPGARSGQSSTGNRKVAAPRANFVEKAAQAYAETFETNMLKALEEAL